MFSNMSSIVVFFLELCEGDAKTKDSGQQCFFGTECKRGSKAPRPSGSRPLTFVGVGNLSSHSSGGRFRDSSPKSDAMVKGNYFFGPLLLFSPSLADRVSAKPKVDLVVFVEPLRLALFANCPFGAEEGFPQLSSLSSSHKRKRPRSLFRS